MRRYLQILFISLFFISFIQCAKKENENSRQYDQRNLDLWIQYNRPDLLSNKTESGMYYEFLREQDPDAERVRNGDYVMVNYRGTNLRNNVYKTRYKDEATVEGSFSYYTHYVPHYMHVSSYMDLTDGEIEALRMMRLNDSIRIYLPPNLAYGEAGATFYYGYEGSFTLGENSPVISELVVKEIIPDPVAYEMNQVYQKAETWGKTPQDTIWEGFYLDILEWDNSQPLIGHDSLIYFEYSLRFLDDFLIETNVDSVARKDRNDYEVNSPVEYTVNYSSSAITALYKVFSSGKVRYNSTFRMLFISDYGYGIQEQSASSTEPVIYAYTPLWFEIRTMPYGYDPDEE